MEQNLRYFGVNFKICIDAIDEFLVDGRAYSTLLKTPLPFQDFIRLVLTLDKVLDIQNFPQAFQYLRSFGPDVQSDAQPAPSYVALSPEESLSAQAIESAAGKEMTLSISVISRRKATWQGLVTFHQDDSPYPFSSSMELFQLLLQRVFSCQGSDD